MTPLSPLLLLACTAQPPSPPSYLEPIQADQAVRVVLSDAAGVDVIEVPVRLVNRLGASVPGTAAEVALQTAGATLESSRVELDAEGQGIARIFPAEPGPVVLKVIGSEDGAATGATSTSVALGAPAPTLMLDRVLPRPASLTQARAMARGTRGLALVSEAQVWWLPSEPGAVGWSVLEADFEILGARAVEVDDDGVRDLAVWSEQAVILLRGRPEGGYSWGAGWTTPDMQVIGVSVVDLDGDQLADVVVGQSDEGAARVELLIGDGVWGFRSVSPLELTYPAMDVVAADEDFDGRPDISVLDARTGWLRRYTRTEGRWTGNAPSTLDSYTFQLGSRLLPPADLNGDGILDPIGISGPSSGTQSAVFYLVDEARKYEQAYAEIQADVGDVDGDGMADLLLMEDGLLHRIRYDEAIAGFVVENLSGLADTGPIAAGDLNGDAVVDLAVLEDGVILHIGELDATGSWTIGRPTLLELATGLDGPYLIRDVNNDNRMDIVGVVQQGGGAGLRVWIAGYDATTGPSFTPQGSLELNATGEVHALINCGQDFYALSDNSGAGGEQPDKVFRVRISSDGTYTPVVQHSGGATGTLLACGYPDSATNKRFAVATTSGDIVVYAYNLEVLAEEQIGPVEGIAYADMDGDGIDELQTCTEAGCQLIGVDLDLDGTDELIRGGGAVSVEGWGSRLETGLSGHISVGDLDKDGQEDVLVIDRSTGRITAIPTLTAALGPASGWYSTEPIDGAVLVVDYDKDGRSELVFRRGNTLIGTRRTVLGGG